MLSRFLVIFLAVAFLLAGPAQAQTATGYYVRPGISNFPTSPQTNGTVCLDSTTGLMYVWDGSAWSLINITAQTLNNYTATVNPGSGDDNTEGYSVGSVWYNTTSNSFYICTSAATDNAVWILLSNGTQVQNNFAATGFPTTANDNTQGYSIGSQWLIPSFSELWTCFGASTGAAIWYETASSTFNAFTYTPTGATIQNSVTANQVQAVPSSSGTLNFPSGNYFVNGQTISGESQSFTYAATSWTYDFAENTGLINHIPEPYGSGIPSDPQGGVCFEKVVTDGSGIITAVVQISPTVAPVLPSLLQSIPTTGGLVFQTDPTNVNGVAYEQIQLESIDTSALTTNPIVFNGTDIVSAPIAPSGMDFSSLTSGPLQATGGATPTTGPITLNELDTSLAGNNQLLGYNGGYLFLNGNVGVSVSTSTTITLTANSPSLQSLDPTGGSIIANLPQASTCAGKVFYFANTATTGINTVTPTLFAGDSTVGTVTLTMVNGSVVGLESDGTTNWIVIK